MGNLASVQSLKASVQAIFEADSQSDCPVVQAVSLLFWEKFESWALRLQERKQPFLIGLTGASGSGKSFLREQLLGKLNPFHPTAAFTQDNYYIDFESQFKHLPLHTFYDTINFDDPAYIRFDKLAQDLNRLKRCTIGETFHIPKFRFGTPSQLPGITQETLAVPVAPILLTEGIHAFYSRETLAFYDLKIFVDIDESIRRERWLSRNIRDNRGITDNMWQTTVECLETHILPAREVADLVINNSAPQANILAFLNALLEALILPQPLPITWPEPTPAAKIA